MLGQQFIVENRPGAGGLIGQSLVLKSPPDGYTLLLAGGSMAGARYVNAQVTYDVLRDFTPVSLVETSPFVMVVHPSVPAKNLKEYIALARSQPGKMTYGTIGAGQMPYWSAILFNNMARIKAVEVTYKTGGDAIIDVMGGRLDYYLRGLARAVANKERLRALAVTGIHALARVAGGADDVRGGAARATTCRRGAASWGRPGMRREIVATPQRRDRPRR